MLLADNKKEGLIILLNFYNNLNTSGHLLIFTEDDFLRNKLNKNFKINMNYLSFDRICDCSHNFCWYKVRMTSALIWWSGSDFDNFWESERLMNTGWLVRNVPNNNINFKLFTFRNMVKDEEVIYTLFRIATVLVLWLAFFIIVKKSKCEFW